MAVIAELFWLLVALIVTPLAMVFDLLIAGLAMLLSVAIVTAPIWIPAIAFVILVRALI